jgi:hypothetical protein
MTAPSVGTPGRSVSEVGTGGRVEVGGVAYHACTSGRAIPAGSAVVVTGWRLDRDGPNDRLVLLVRLPGDDGTADAGPPPPPPPDSPTSAGFPPSPPPPPLLVDCVSQGSDSWLLTCGQVAAVLACLHVALSMIVQLVTLTNAERLLSGYQTRDSGQLPWPAVVYPTGASGTDGGSRAGASLFAAKALVVLVGGIAICLGAAMFVVFGRAKAVRAVAVAQDAENRRLWQAIQEVRGMPRADRTG